jgi:hypothetical protein
VDGASSKLPKRLTSAQQRNVPSRTLSEAAATRREAVESSSMLLRLEKANRALQTKLDEAARRVRESQRDADTAARDRKTVLRRCEALEVRVAEMEVERQRMARSADPAAVVQHADDARVRALEARVATLSQAHDAATDTIHKESAALEEARSYIAVLLSALEAKGGGVSLGGGGGAAGAAAATGELQRLRAELDARCRENAARETAAARLEEQFSELQARHERVVARLSDLQSTGGTVGRIAQLQSEQEALLEYLQQRKADVDSLHEQLRSAEDHAARLEADAAKLRENLASEMASKRDAAEAEASMHRQLERALADVQALQQALQSAKDAKADADAQLTIQAHENQEAMQLQVRRAGGSVGAVYTAACCCLLLLPLRTCLSSAPAFLPPFCSGADVVVSRSCVAVVLLLCRRWSSSTRSRSSSAPPRACPVARRTSTSSWPLCESSWRRRAPHLTRETSTPIVRRARCAPLSAAVGIRSQCQRQLCARDACAMRFAMRVRCVFDACSMRVRCVFDACSMRVRCVCDACAMRV